MKLLGELAGTLTKSAIARKLGRSYWSVKAQCSRLSIQSRLTSGYSRIDIQYLLGVGGRSTARWIKRGWLKLQNDRITEASVIKFLREHPEEYRLSRVDETWFKGLLFPSFGRNHMPESVSARSRQSAPLTAA